jgi:hypothetical protein
LNSVSHPTERLRAEIKSFGNSSSDLLALLILGSLILCFCQDLILWDQVPFFRDLGPYFYPLRFALYESFRSGELPLWNRHMAMGFPLLAAFQSGVFYPPHLLLLILPFFPAIRAIFVLHFLIAGIGAYYLCRNWRFPPYLSIMSALLFAFGGTVVSLSNLLNHFQTAIWLPWAILFWEKLLCSLSWKNFLTFTLITGLQFLAGSPELYAMSMVLVLLDGLSLRKHVPEISLGKLLYIFLSANFLVVALVMVQLLPTAELFLESRRQQPIPPQEALHWSLKPLSLLNLFFLDKEIDLTVSRGLRFFFASEPQFLVSYYLGAICLFGLSLWLCFSSIREKITLLGLVAASLIVALGSYTPIYPFLLHHVAFLGAFRFPEKVFFFTYALFLYMTVKGLGGFLLEGERSLKKSLVAVAAVGVMWLGLYLFLRFNVNLLARFIAIQTGNPFSSVAHGQMVAGSLVSLDRQVVLCMGFLLLMIIGKVNAIRTSLFGLLMVSTVFVDLASAHRSFLFPLHSDIIYESPRVMRAPDVDVNRLFYFWSGRNLHPSSVTVQGHPTFKEATALSFQALLPNAGVFYGFDYLQEIDALGRQPYTDFLFFANQLDFTRQMKLLRTFNVRYLIAVQPLEEHGIRLIGHFPDYFSWLYKIDDNIPRVYVVNKTVVERDSKQVLRLLSSAGFDPARQVVLDNEIPLRANGALEAAAKIVRYENRFVTIETSGNEDAVLILADSYYPGWKAYVDGKEEIIRRANLFFRAVPVSAGSHIIEFRYEPGSFTVGFAISAVTFVALTITTIFISFRIGSRKPFGR